MLQPVLALPASIIGPGDNLCNTVVEPIPQLLLSYRYAIWGPRTWVLTTCPVTAAAIVAVAVVAIVAAATATTITPAVSKLPRPCRDNIVSAGYGVTCFFLSTFDGLAALVGIRSLTWTGHTDSLLFDGLPAY